jgi:hypothetical protein
MNGITDREDLHAARFDVIAERGNHALVLHLPLGAAARGKGQQRRAPVAVDDDPHVAPEPIGVPALVVSAHVEPAFYTRRPLR